MFDKLVELLTNWWMEIKPIVRVRAYEEAVLLRFGIVK